MKNLIRVASVLTLLAQFVLAQNANQPVPEPLGTGLLPQLENCPVVIEPKRDDPDSRRSVRKKRFMPSAPAAAGTDLSDPLSQIPTPIANDAKVWPQPLGSTFLSPKAASYRMARPVARNTPIPMSLRPALAGQEPGNNTPPPALPPWTAVDQEFSFYPHVTPDSDSPENMPLPELVPQPRYSMALPEELNVPLFLPAGPSTGRVSSLLSPEEQPQGLIPMITQPERFTDPPTWDPTTVTSGQPFVYWHPLMKPGSRPLPAGGSLGIQLYDRFLNGGYGNTDIDGQRQVIINAAQQIPGDAGPFNP